VGRAHPAALARLPGRLTRGARRPGPPAAARGRRRTVGGQPAEPHPGQVRPPADPPAVPLAQLGRRRGRLAVQRTGDPAELGHLHRYVVGAAQYPQQHGVRGERADPRYRQQRPAHLVVGRGAQPRLVEAGDPVEDLAQPRRPLAVAGVLHEIAAAAERVEGGEGDVQHSVDGAARSEFGRDAPLAGGRVPLGAALGEREVRRALGEAGEPYLVQPGDDRQHPSHGGIATGDREEPGQVVVEPEPVGDGALDRGRLVGAQRAGRVHDEVDAAVGRSDVDHHGLGGTAGVRDRLAHPVAGDGLVARARGEAAHGPQRPGERERCGGGEAGAVSGLQVVGHAGIVRRGTTVPTEDSGPAAGGP